MRHDMIEVDPAHNRLLTFLRRHLPITDSYREGKLVVRENGCWTATPLLLVLILIEASDVMFAIDSIPAVFAVTRDPFIAFSANAFAILGLRSLFFVTIGALDRFVYLNRGVAAVLVFVACKMLLSDVIKIPTPYALAGVALILGVAIVASILRPQPIGNGNAGA
jgi:tellurite resistance protein TerC